VTPLRSFWWTLALLAAVVGAGSIIYAQQQHIPMRVVAAVWPSLFVELACYAAVGFVAVRERLGALPRERLQAILMLTAITPAVIYPALLGLLDPSRIVILFFVLVPVIYWYTAFPHKPWADFAFAALLIALMLLRRPLFRDAYPNPLPDLRLDFLSQLMLIRTAAAVMLLIRRAEGIGYGFVPTPAEWRIGFQHFLRALPFVVATGFALGIMRLGAPTPHLWLYPVYAIGAFAGCFFVVALSEEFLLRGVLLRRFIGVTRSILAGSLLAALISGLVHLPFRGPWNWKFAILSAVAHWFFGQAFLEAKSIRAGMVAHALTVTTWVMVFAKSA
jgi:membrane protease YdiL (CAAX protease family)